MSLSVKLITSLAVILLLTTGIQALVSTRVAKQQVEDDIKKHLSETATTIELELKKQSSFSKDALNEKLKTVLKRAGLTSIELGREEAGSDLVYRWSNGPSGIHPELVDAEAAIPASETFELVSGPDGDVMSLSRRIHIPAGRVSESGAARYLVPARLTVTSSIQEADAVAGKMSQVYLVAALASTILILLAIQLLVSRQVGRPIANLMQVMTKVEGGQLDVAAPLGAGREFDQLARVVNAMLTRVRGNDQEKTEQVERATADLARKNRDLAELNDLLVSARRDLTAKERLAALGQLAGTIAHELGNPLNSISGHVQLLERNEELPAQARADLRTVESEVRRMTDVIRRFLDSTRGLRPAPEQVDLRDLVGEALDMSLSAEARSRLHVKTHVAPELAGVVTDPSLVRHVLTNLIANAVDAMPAGGTLEVAAQLGDDELQLSVADTGSGIHPEDRRRIFEPFYTTKERGKGTGLGLAICREIARALKGRIEVESEPGHGATFTLSVPIQQVPGMAPLTPLEA